MTVKISKPDKHKYQVKARSGWLGRRTGLTRDQLIAEIRNYGIKLIVAILYDDPQEKGNGRTRQLEGKEVLSIWQACAPQSKNRNDPST